MSPIRLPIRISFRQKQLIGLSLHLIIAVHDQIGPPGWTRCTTPRDAAYDAGLFSTFRQLNCLFGAVPACRSRVRLSSLELATCIFAVKHYRREVKRKRAAAQFSSELIGETLNRLEIYFKRVRRMDPTPHPVEWERLLRWIRCVLFAWRMPRLKTPLSKQAHDTIAHALALTLAELEKRNVKVVDVDLVRKQVRHKLKLLARKGCNRECFVREAKSGEVLADFVVAGNQGIVKPKERWEIWRDTSECIQQALAQ